MSANLSDQGVALLEGLQGSWTGQWEMPSWTCIDPKQKMVLLPSGQKAHPFGLCCVDHLEQPMSTLISMSFLQWHGKWALQKMRTPLRHALNNGMLVFGSGGTGEKRHRLAKGNSFSTTCFEAGGDCDSRCEEVTSILTVHPVRCCSDQAIPGWVNNRCADIWHKPLASQGCLELEFSDAYNYCIADGGRLCTEDELSRNCASETGCYFDERLVWTRDSCGNLSSTCSADIQPPVTAVNPSCATEQVNTDRCEQRRAGTLKDGLCAQTCETCGPCEDVPGFIDEWGGKSVLVPEWNGTCAEWVPVLTPCSEAVEVGGYTQNGEDDVLANCRRSCGLCPDEEEPKDATVFMITNVTPVGDSYRIQARNYLKREVCMYVQPDNNNTKGNDIRVSITSRSEIYGGYWHEAFYCGERQVPKTVSGCNESSVWPEDWLDVYLGLVQGRITNDASNPISSSWRTSIGRLKLNTGPASSTAMLSPEASQPWLLGVAVGCSVLAALILCGSFLLFLRRMQRTQVRKKQASAASAACDVEAAAVGPGSHCTLTMTCPTETDFRDAHLGEVVSVGMKEHWMICWEDLVLGTNVIGKGGFGEVRRAKLYGGTEVVVKLAIGKGGTRDHQIAAMSSRALANELGLFRRIRHPNIVLFHGVVIGKSPEGELNLCLVLEWVDGSDFRAFLKDRRAKGSLAQDCIDYEDAAMNNPQLLIPEHKVMQDVALGMQYLHAQHPPIIHRDLKPANILVETKIIPPRAKIADFGVSTLMDKGEISSVAGTNHYMAPEVVKKLPYNTSADLFSFGVVLGNVLDVALQSTLDPKTVLAAVEEVLGPLARVCQQCLKEDPALRPTFSAVLEMLSQVTRSPTGHSTTGSSTSGVSAGTGSTRRATTRGTLEEELSPRGANGISL
ncbi:unnamed protein product [Polarella glacialis]|uniref:Protein kinase domain-containing protein n=1 Tax=Polarella glacialis TaxID=89957 RepID=A0A813I5N0_POLGL|nr:unnamed protein product [Polarella glacialis]